MSGGNNKWRSAVLCVLSVSVLLPVIALAEGVAPRAPNIVLLLADDLGFADLGAYGSEIQTPNIDGLAASGMRFSNFHVAASCAPTRAMLMTGLDSHTVGVANMPEARPDEPTKAPASQRVLETTGRTSAATLPEGGNRPAQNRE